MSARTRSGIALLSLACLLLAGVPVAQAATEYGLTPSNGQGPYKDEYRLGDVVRLILTVKTGSSDTFVTEAFDVYNALTGTYVGRFDSGKSATHVPAKSVKGVFLNWPQQADGKQVPAGRYRLDHLLIYPDGAPASVTVDVAYAPDLEIVSATTTPPASSPLYPTSIETRRFQVCFRNTGNEPVTSVRMAIDYSTELDPAGTTPHRATATDVTLNNGTPRCSSSTVYSATIEWKLTVDQARGGAALAREARITLDPDEAHWEWNRANNVAWVSLAYSPIPLTANGVPMLP